MAFVIVSAVGVVYRTDSEGSSEPTRVEAAIPVHSVLSVTTDEGIIAVQLNSRAD